MIKCPNCSAELKYDVSASEVVCEYCGSKFDPKELDIKAKYSEEDYFEGKSYRCRECGATLLTFDDTAITFCSYCGSQAMIESKMVKNNNPDYIIPFKKTYDECISNYMKKVKKNFFAPKYMKDNITVKKFRGIFIPYGIYKLSYHNNCSNNGSVYKKRRGDYKYYDDYSIVSHVDCEYDGISYDLISKFYDKYSHSIPFDYNECEKFSPNYLIGFYADSKDVDLKVYDSYAKNIARGDSTKRLSKEKIYKKHGCSNPIVPVDVEERSVGMFPLYFLAVRDKSGKHINYAIVNGQTGEVAAYFPIDFKKYVFASFIFTIIIFFLINSHLLILPKNVVIFSLIVSIICFFISNYQLNKMNENKNHEDDLGVISNDIKNNNENKNGKRITSMKVKKDNNIFKILVLIIGLIFFNFFLELLIFSFGTSASSLLFFAHFLSFIIFFIIIYKIDKNPSSNVIEYKVNSKYSFGDKFKKYLYKPFIAAIILIITLILNPVDDLYYYGSSFFSFIFIILTFKDIILEHNEIVSNPLPQLSIRGGDENE